MGNSTRTVQSVVDYARTFPDIAPVIDASGFQNVLALRKANQVMADLLAEPFNWKFNSFNVTPFYTISWQQDYAIPGLTTLSWIERADIVDINNTQYPQPTWPVERRRELPIMFSQFGYPAQPGQICWLPNSRLRYATWGGPLTPQPGQIGGPMNPQPGQTLINPLGQTTTPVNPWVQVKDPNGNLQVITTYGVIGNTQPTWPAANSPAGTNTADGTCVWTVVDPVGQGFRLAPLPPQSGVVFQMNVVGQARPIPLTTLQQNIEPIPDDCAVHFERGFIAGCYEHHPDPVKQGTWIRRYTQWKESIMEMLKSKDREGDAYGFYPDRNVLDDGISQPPGPAWPFGYSR